VLLRLGTLQGGRAAKRPLILPSRALSFLVRILRTSVGLAALLGALLCGCHSGVSTTRSVSPAKPVVVGLLCQSNDWSSLKSYRRAIEENGARIILLPCPDSTNPTSLPSAITALLIPGGDDVDPALYHATATAKLDSPDRHFDDYECAAIRQATARHLPILGICRGLQILNVYSQGTLYTDLPSQLGTNVVHRLRPTGLPPSQPCFHEIAVQKESLLFRSVKAERLKVNSFHHQGIKDLGQGLVATAWADDGLVEGFENREGTILAVQFHPEKMRATNVLFNAIFRDFIHRAAVSQP